MAGGGMVRPAACGRKSHARHVTFPSCAAQGFRPEKRPALVGREVNPFPGRFKPSVPHCTENRLCHREQ